jgi:hypothetical protein
MSNMIKTPMSEVNKLIEKYNNHIDFCNEKFKKSRDNKLSMSTACWLEERSAYQKVVIDLQKLLLYDEPDTDLEDPRPSS